MPVLVSRLSDDVALTVNAEFTAAYGYEAREVEGVPSRELHFVEDDRQRALDAHAHGDLESVEVRLKSASGACLWAQADLARFSLDGTEEVLLTTLYDIGARKQAEALVAEMALFPDMNPGPVVSMDLDAVVRRSNAAARERLGQDLEGRCFWDVCPQISEATRSQALAGGPPVQEDVEVGEYSYRLTFAHTPGADTVFVFGTDVTAQMRARRELEERARFPAMNPGPVARLTADATVIRANPAASRLFGKDSLVGLSWRDLCPEIDDALWEKARSSETPVQHEADIGDRCISFTLRHEPIADQVFVYGSDVTELKSAERALAELARFPDMNPGPVCRLDRHGVVLLANPAARAVFECDDLSGRRWLELVPTLDETFWQHVLTADGATAVEAKIGGRDFVLTHAPGSEGLYVFVYGSDVTREKEAERVLRQSERMATLGTLAAGVAHELNNPAAAAQRAAQQLEHSFAELEKARIRMGAARVLLEHAEHLAELDAKASEAATCPCLLDPLERSDREAELEEWLEERGAEAPWEVAPALVEGGVELAALVALAERIGDEHVGLVATWHAHSLRVYRLLGEIRQGAGRLVEIVGAMKDYSYLGQAPVQNVNVNDGIRSTLVILRSKLKTGITVEQELAADLPLIEAYGSELNQVWTNLIDNAADAMNGQGQIRLRTSANDGHVVVQVEDNGPGIPPEVRERVFDAFFTTKAPGKGTGLGLNTSYNIVVQKHGGTIRVDSEPGRTRFTVELPLRRAEATA